MFVIRMIENRTSPMTAPDPTVFTRQLRNLRQTRRFCDRTVPEDVVDDLLEVARWSGSSKNTQPWHFIVVTDAELRKQIAEAGPFAGFLEGAPVVIVLVMAGSNPRSEPYDEGRVSERLMLAADAHGLGAGTGWFVPDDGGERQVKKLLGVPDGMVIRSALGIGYPDATDPRPRGVSGGRKPLSEIVSRDRFGG
jgi:nitroreductase